MADATLELLKELTEANGIPGYEGPVRDIVRKHLEPLGKLSQDKIGSVTYFRYHQFGVMAFGSCLIQRFHSVLCMRSDL